MFRKTIYTIARAQQKAMIAVINAYRFLVSPLLGDCCRFYPSCSEYAKSAIEQHGAFRGFALTMRRLLKCHPFNPGGIDPVPKQK